jgi:hypothetical protein
MKTWHPFILTLMLVCFSLAASGSAASEEGCDNPCGKPTAWQDFNSFTLRAGAPGQAAYSQWRGQFDKESDDIQIDVEQSVSGRVVKGKILMIGGRTMAIQGPIAETGYEIDALDAAVLQLQLVTKLLGRALPDGPASVKSTQAIDFTDSRTGVEIATPSAGGMIQPPWRIIGKLKRLPPDGIQYTLTLTSRRGSDATNERQESTVTFAGTLFNSANTKIDDKLSLEKWNVFGVGPQSRQRQGGTIIDYGAAPTPTTYKTVADVRKQIEADNYAGGPDPAKDFTGFWKAECEDPFGLQIKHFGTDGKYSIVFCGPGGCGDPANEGSKTFITKDPHYQVISEDETKEQSTGGWKTWHRCTKDTHPVLKYEDKE